MTADLDYLAALDITAIVNAQLRQELLALADERHPAGDVATKEQP